MYCSLRTCIVPSSVSCSACCWCTEPGTTRESANSFCIHSTKTSVCTSSNCGSPYTLLGEYPAPPAPRGRTPPPAVPCSDAFRRQVGADPVRAVDHRLLQRYLHCAATLRHRTLRQAVLTGDHAQGKLNWTKSLLNWLIIIFTALTVCTINIIVRNI